MKFKIIVAGNRGEFERHCAHLLKVIGKETDGRRGNDFEIDGTSYVYGDSILRARGGTDLEIVFYGSYESRADFEDWVLLSETLVRVEAVHGLVP